MSLKVNLWCNVICFGSLTWTRLEAHLWSGIRYSDFCFHRSQLKEGSGDGNTAGPQKIIDMEKQKHASNILAQYSSTFLLKPLKKIDISL